MWIVKLQANCPVTGKSKATWDEQLDQKLANSSLQVCDSSVPESYHSEITHVFVGWRLLTHTPVPCTMFEFKIGKLLFVITVYTRTRPWCVLDYMNVMCPFRILCWVPKRNSWVFVSSPKGWIRHWSCWNIRLWSFNSQLLHRSVVLNIFGPPTFLGWCLILTL